MAIDVTAGLDAPAHAEDPIHLVAGEARRLIEHRRAMTRIPRRGWLVRRALLAADLAGLTSAFAISEFAYAGHVIGRQALSISGEWLLFFGVLPVWVGVGKLYGLYDRDEERTDHSTADDVFGVFHMITIGAWVVFLMSSVLRLAN